MSKGSLLKMVNAKLDRVIDLRKGLRGLQQQRSPRVKMMSMASVRTRVETRTKTLSSTRLT